MKTTIMANTPVSGPALLLARWEEIHDEEQGGSWEERGEIGDRMSALSIAPPVWRNGADGGAHRVAMSMAATPTASEIRPPQSMRASNPAPVVVPMGAPRRLFSFARSRSR
jgi:hypothetical protein